MCAPIILHTGFGGLEGFAEPDGSPADDGFPSDPAMMQFDR